MKKISVIVPVYFNADSLELQFEALLKQRDILNQSHNLDMEAIYINDGSGDSSLETLKAIKQENAGWVKIISFTRNFGQSHAIRAGFKYASGDCVTVMNADLQDPAELIVKMAEAWLQGNSYVICERSSREDSAISKVFSAILYKYLRAMIIPDYPVGGFDLFLLDKKYFSYIINTGKNIHPIFLSYWLGSKPFKVLYDRKKRPFGKSRWTFRKKVAFMVDTTLGFSATPMRLASVVGIIVSSFSFFYGAYTFIYALFNGTPVSGYASIVCLLSFLLGLIVVMLSIIGEYLARIFEHCNNKPEYVIEEEL